MMSKITFLALICSTLGYRRHTSPTLANITLLLDGINYNLQQTRPSIYQGLSLAANIGRNQPIANTAHDSFLTSIFQYDDLSFSFDESNSIISLTMTNLQLEYADTWFGIYEVPYTIICEGQSNPQVSIDSITLRWKVYTDNTCLLYVDYLHPIITNDKYLVNYEVDSGTCNSLIDVFVGDLTNKMEHAVQYALPNIVNNEIKNVLKYIPTNVTLNGNKGGAFANMGYWTINFGVCFEKINIQNQQISATVSMQFNQSLNQSFQFNTYKVKHNAQKKNIFSNFWVERFLCVFSGIVVGVIGALSYLMCIRRENKRIRIAGYNEAIELIDENENEESIQNVLT